MKKIKLYIATSIDGYIARQDGNLDWLMKYPINSKTNYGYDCFYESVDTVIMGGQTYRDIVCMDVIWPYKDKATYVITRNPGVVKDNIRFMTEDILKTIDVLREEKGKDIWLVGGGKLVAMLLNNDMIDEMIITVVPVILGSGIPLFPESSKESEWSIKDSVAYKNGINQISYKKEIKGN
ncbi:MAG: dihydrofolate reductase family protein [Dysgonomonas mossii]|uniref:dihydrofolate reductase family protein n=1 Tax=Dysgonomonas mossii TaxID=163665 RepID=UPI003994081F